MNVEQCWILLLYGWLSFFLTRVKILLSGCPGTGRIQPLGDLLLEVVIKKTPINLGVLQPYNLRNFFLENLPQSFFDGSHFLYRPYKRLFRL
jgi:hypothetical protein